MKPYEPPTPEQIKNLRQMLLLTVGTYAMLMTDQQVIAYRDKMQTMIDKEEEKITQERKRHENSITEQPPEGNSSLHAQKTLSCKDDEGI